jgi:peptidoglycan-N-acetylglucosamine deacetylase
MKIKYCFNLLSRIVFTLLLVIPLTCSANTKPKYIALTFDDGPSDTYTQQILSILKSNQIKATFFVTGANAKKNPEMLKKVYTEGNDIGNHTYSHPNLAKLSAHAIEAELTKTNEQIYKAINVYPILFRPPFGMSSAQSNQVAAKLGFRKITWNYMVNDYDANKTTADIIAKSIINHASPGAIMTMHDCCGDRSKTVAALPLIISALKNQGYQLVTVSELLKIKPYRSSKTEQK